MRKSIEREALDKCTFKPDIRKSQKKISNLGAVYLGEMSSTNNRTPIVSPKLSSMTS
jgi:hypothetical protein